MNLKGGESGKVEGEGERGDNIVRDGGKRFQHYAVAPTAEGCAAEDTQ